MWPLTLTRATMRVPTSCTWTTQSPTCSKVWPSRWSWIMMAENLPVTKHEIRNGIWTCWFIKFREIILKHLDLPDDKDDEDNGEEIVHAGRCRICCQSSWLWQKLMHPRTCPRNVKPSTYSTKVWPNRRPNVRMAIIFLQYNSTLEIEILIGHGLMYVSARY